MSANANIAARFRIDGSFSYRRNSVAGFPPTAPAAFGQQKTFAVTGSGAGVASKGHAIEIDIAANSTTSLDLASFNDMHGDAVVWTALKVAALLHDPDSVSTGTVEVTGAAANAAPELRSSKLAAGQCGVLFFDPDGTGLTITSPNSKIVIANNSLTLIATIVLFLEGE